MKVIPPIAITPASSSVTEPATGETAWVSGGTYVAGDLRIRTETHRVYECTVDVTGSSTPPEDDVAHWRDAAPTNQRAMFDLSSSVRTVMTGAALVVEVAPGRRINAIGLVGLHGASVQIEMEVGAATIHDETTNLLLRNTTTWLQYYYGEFRVRQGLVRFNLPMSAGATIRVTIQPTSGYAACRAIVLGMAEDLGTILDAPTSGQISLSKVTRDEIGGATSFVKRRTVPSNTHRVRAPAARLNRLRELRADLDASPALFSGADANEASHFFDTLLVLGFARKWDISMRADAVHSDLQLEEI